MKIVVLMNTGDGMFWEYIPGRAVLSHAHTFDFPGTTEIVVNQLAEHVFTMCNVDPDSLDDLDPFLVDQIKHYRSRRNRSLSVGDVVVLLDGEAPIIALACQREGWQPIGDRLAGASAEEILASVDLSDIDNHLEFSLAWDAHVTIRDNPPMPFISAL